MTFILLRFPGFVQTIKGEGMPIYQQSGFGDLFIEYNVVLPVEISSHARRSMFLIFPSLLGNDLPLSNTNSDLSWQNWQRLFT